MRLLISLIIVCSVAVSCSDSSTLVNNKEPDKKKYDRVEYIPTVIGRYWITEKDIKNDTTYISKDTTINSNTFYVLESPSFVYEGFVVTTKRYFAYSDSAMVIGRMDEGNLVDRMMYKFPEQGSTSTFDTYDQTKYNNNRWRWYTAVLSRDTLITTPSGDYQTHLFYSEQKEKGTGRMNFKESYYFAEDVGIVRKMSQPTGSYVSNYDLIETGHISELDNFPLTN